MIPTICCEVLFRPDSDALKFLPEGPYTGTESVMSWVGIQHGSDSTVGSLNLLNLRTSTNQSHELPGRPGFAFPADKAGVYVCGVERSIGLFDCGTGRWEELAKDIDRGVDNTIVNDGMVYGNNLIFGCKELEFKTKKAGLYLFRGSDRKMIQLRDDQICSNGKAIVSNESGLTLIDIDSPTQTVTTASLDIEAGRLGEQKIIVDVTHEKIFPDGLIVTPDNNSVIVAFYDPADPQFGVARQYGIESGQIERIWSCPGSPRVTCPQLINFDGEIRLVLTTAVEGMEPEQLAKHPNAGCLFVGATEFDLVCDQPLFPIPQ